MATRAQIELVLDVAQANKELHKKLQDMAGKHGGQYANMISGLTEAAGKAALAAQERGMTNLADKMRVQYAKMGENLLKAIKTAEDSTDPSEKAHAYAEMSRLLKTVNSMAADDYADKMTAGFRSALLNRDTMKNFGREMTSTMEKSFSRVDVDMFKDLGVNLLESLKKGTAAKAGALREQEAAALASGDAAAAAALGRSAMALTGITAALAGAAAAFAMFAAYSVAADEYLAKMNQTLLEGASYGDILGTTMEKTGKGLGITLSSARKAAADVALAYGMSADETARALSELGQAGIKYSEILQGDETAVGQQRKFRKELEDTIGVSKALGLSVQEVAQYRNALNTELNIPLEQTFDAFSMIHEAATRSGMSTRNFFTAVSQATSGMALYNVRVEEAVGLIGAMAKSVGETDAAAAFKGLVGERTDGAQEAMKKMVLASGGDPRKLIPAFTAATERAVATFAEKMVGRQDEASKGMGADMASMFFDPSKRGELSKRLASMSGQQISDIMAQLSPDMAREFAKVAGVAGGMRGTAQAQGASFAQMSDAERTAMTLQIMKLLEGQGVNASEALFRDSRMRAFFESLGLGSQEVMTAATSLQGDMRAINDILAGRGTEASRARLEQAGFKVEGNKVLSATGAEVRTEDDYLVGLGSAARAQAQDLSNTKSSGEQMAESTATMAQILETWSRTKLFESVFQEGKGYLWKFVNDALGGDLTPMDREAALAAAAKVREAQRGVEEGPVDVGTLGTGIADMAARQDSRKMQDFLQSTGLQNDPVIAKLVKDIAAERNRINAENYDDVRHSSGSYRAAEASPELNSLYEAIGSRASKLSGNDVQFSTSGLDGLFSVKATTPSQDFIYRPGQGIQKFSPNDTVVGMKPGGPIATGGGMGGHVTINVNGGDPAATYNTVTKAVRAAMGR